MLYYETLSNDVSHIRQEGTVHLNFTAFNRSVVPCISNTSKNPYSTQTKWQFSIPARLNSMCTVSVSTAMLIPFVYLRRTFYSELSPSQDEFLPGARFVYQGQNIQPHIFFKGQLEGQLR